METTKIEDEIQELKRTVSEIQSLRRKNEILEAKISVFNDMVLIFKTYPPIQGVTSQPDIVRDIESTIKDKEYEVAQIEEKLQEEENE